MPKRTISYQSWVTENLSDPHCAANYLNAARADSPAAFFKALRKVSESHEMKKLAEKAGVSRESLYRMMSETGNPTYSSLEGILGALGLKQIVAPRETAEGSGKKGEDHRTTTVAAALERGKRDARPSRRLAGKEAAPVGSRNVFRREGAVQRRSPAKA
jgi:probable addiction module antidote protein